MIKPLLYRKVLVVCIFMASLLLVSCESAQNKNNSQGSAISSEEVEGLKTIGMSGLNDLKKKYSDKVILVNFFASWCPPCKEETPEFIEVYNENKDKFVIIGLSIDDSKKDAVNFINDMGIPYPVFHAKRSLEKRLNITGVPTNIFYAPGGELYNFYVGALSKDFVEKVIAQISG
ncbi:alkyl hydroperoxide reductase/ Thiol specific antioxidant/ Mal allergen [Flexistipes sinusarabici DSM 4947]|uniref:Alkyl hydroperoxide reductase/ Thiol specific antioxidant/ Mal allergen n=1 Tax=Flexistipes sinusarabici (strain ATCC 49648 / DSM 4947 / MAS 10) TaxID=717231 RepID=F8E506_FLESM|nr:TlpA disulfide reductase family protein [Flexistipes sinusarabici]AEI15642.1 alkyl hydroperoxide reductase/ Thiol specific antioxidant/ Mal allergen [Flexistipes sinusarabici DSM 4947]